MNKLLVPLTYLRLNHPEKRKWDVYCVLILGLPASALIWWFEIAFYGDPGIIAICSGLLGILTGFFIAALAAVATFQKPGMDSPLEGMPITLRQPSGRSEILTRRRFVTILFGYLSFSSFFLYLIGGIANIVHKRMSIFLESWIGSSATDGVNLIFILFYVCWFTHILITTMVGLYYLIEGIHREPKQKVGPPPSQP